MTLSEYHGCNAGGPGTFLTMSRWAKWNSVEAYGYGRLQSGATSVRVWLHRVATTNAHGTWRYYSLLTIRIAPHFATDVIYGNWSWNRGQWILKR